MREPALHETVEDFDRNIAPKASPLTAFALWYYIHLNTLNHH